MQIKNQTTGADELTIDTVAPELKIGEIPVSADRRSTKEAPLTDAERIRRVVLPAGTWSTAAATLAGTHSQALTDVLTQALRSIANDRLKDYLAEQPLARTVALADYQVGALLAWSADTATSRGSLTFTREQVEAWFPTSTLAARFTGKENAAKLAFVGNRLATLAAKNHGLKQESDADKLITLLAEDAENTLVVELIGRLQHIAKGFAAKKADSTISLDDL